MAALLLLLGCSAPPQAATPSPTPTPPPSPSAAPILTPDRTTVSDVACKTVNDCWLDERGAPIARPKKLHDKPLPHGDCGAHLEWLQHELRCDQNRCTAIFVGDKC